ncbi:hypothetical protein [Salipiger mangrovisoli]|uniref:Uncharacterized protein n=1 Tax=Salipiger mangrovisoli TaxID=2865933 RepID=A0ABR9WVB8_9RHOB|nr:hypothetical protein [Salipiger mangrovisoli]MBE9635228.1 hypothetical protein [Salipiger mangrovisoli]
MSDPVTNVEIEDVLSSIRRLVSEDSHLDSASEPLRSARPAPAGRLVLTPALRVQEPDAEIRDISAPEAQDRHAAPLAARLVPSEEEIAEVARNTPKSGDRFGLADVDDVEEAPFIEVDDSTVERLAEASIADFFSLKLRDTAPAPTAPAVADAAEPKEGSLAQKIAELEEMIARSTHEFEPERGEEAPAAIFRHQPVPEEQGAAPAPVPEEEDEDSELASRPMPEPELVDEPYALEAFAEDLASDVAEEGDSQLDDGAEDAVDEDPGLIFRSAEPAASAAQESDAEPEPVAAPVRRPVKILRNPVWQRSQSNLRTEEPVQEPVEPAQEPAAAAEVPAVAEALPAGFDEDRLRALIAEVVREELQGALGERVTRNVRKMVRRELHRLLSSEDLD